MATPPTWNPDGSGQPPRRRSVMGRPGAASGSSGPAVPPSVPPGGRAAPAPVRPAGTAQGGRRASSAAGSRRSTGGRPSGRRRLIDYPRQGKTGIRRWLPSWRLVLGLASLGVLAVVGAFVWLYVSTPVPSPADFADAQTTTVYYADGTTEMGTFGVQNRVLVDAEVIPQHVKEAVVAGEDRSFYRNPGVDPVGILRALYTNLRYGERQGGSSITQQYAERYYFDSTVTSYSGKLKEAILAIKLDRQQDKDQILSNYLNTIYFGRDSYGIETAARSYFGHGAGELTVAEGALLAAVIPSPNNFDPRVSPEQAERRWTYVVDGMVATGALTQAERDALVLPETVEYSRSDTYAGPRGYLLAMVRQEVIEQVGISEEQLDQRGYRITTTIDPALQTMLEESVAAVPADHAPNLKIAGVTLSPADGAILALYGGPDYLTVARNAVTQDNAQAGSTFKPFTLVAYLENGGSLKSRYSGANGFPLPGFPNDKVSNFGGASYGTIDVTTATAKSVNTVYAQLNDEVGPEATLEVAIRAGLPEGTSGLDANLANVLGTASPHPLDMAAAYNTFAADGLRTEPFIVRTMTYLDGRAVHEGGGTPERAFEADVMADVTHALQAVVSRGGTATKVAGIGYPVAGKTGTSTDNRSAWFVGFTRQLTTAVAMYQVGPNGEEEMITPFAGYREITGGSAPADLWTAYMTRAMEGRERLDFPPPADVGEPNTPPMVEVPSVVGLTEAEAVTALGRVGLEAAVVTATDPAIAEGLVISTDPVAATEVEQGSTVTVTVSTGPGTVPVPDVLGLASADAVSALEAAGFTVTVVEEASDTVPADAVISADPSAGSQAAPGSTVTVVVSTGPAEPDPGDPGDPGDPVDPGAPGDPGDGGDAGGGG